MKKRNLYQNPELNFISVSADILTSSTDQYVINGYDDGDFDLGDKDFE